MTDEERLDNHGRRIGKLERDTEMTHGLHTRQIDDHEHRIDALERLSRTDMWASVAVGGYQQALTQTQEIARDLVRRVEGIEGREVQGLSAEDKMILIGILNDLSRDVDMLRIRLAGHVAGDADA